MDNRTEDTPSTLQPVEEEAPRPLDREELVEVFDTQQESEAMVVRGLLESAGIEALISGLQAPQDVLPGVGGVTLRVLPSDAAEARRVIEDYRAGGPEPLDDEGGEPPFNEGSAA